ncbi:response regulator [bacterium]|jgi:CheY-like chemotaxis protein|nr:response regulator [bacterium]MBT3581290.1 response regulator [bacterium]MBT4552650.1 response regulator [bacterium]MBT5988130.1 response regulator [bacterium]MBT7087667.1 response regulator [bacterium]
MDKILIIDDNSCIRAMLKFLLNEHEILEAKDGETALKILKKQKNIKLVITDYQLPGMDGLEIIKWLKTHHPEIAIILISACTKIIVGAKKLEIEHAFPKPFKDIDYILEQIKKIMGR